MKFFTSIFALFSLTALSSAAAIHPSTEKRDVAGDAITLVQNLYAQVLVYDADINATRASLDAGTVSLTTAAAEIRSDLEAITSIVNDAANTASTLSKRSLEHRQAGNETIDLADLLVTLLTEVDNTVNQLVTNLGLGALVTDLLVPLEDALTTLVDAVATVVDGVIAVVVQILDALTTAIGTVLTAVLGGLGLGGVVGGT